MRRVKNEENSASVRKHIRKTKFKDKNSINYVRISYSMKHKIMEIHIQIHAQICDMRMSELDNL